MTEITLEEGKGFKVTCLTPGYGTRDLSYIRWYKLNSTGRHNLTKPMVVARSSCWVNREDLIIKTASHGVQGRYVCERKAPNGSVASVGFNVTFAGMYSKTLSILENRMHVILFYK